MGMPASIATSVGEAGLAARLRAYRYQARYRLLARQWSDSAAAGAIWWLLLLEELEGRLGPINRAMLKMLRGYRP